MNPSESVIVYGVSWCGDCRRSRKVFGELEFPYTWIDIDFDPAGEALVKELNNGSRSVPTILFPDGSMLVEPNAAVLSEKLHSLRA